MTTAQTSSSATWSTDFPSAPRFGGRPLPAARDDGTPANRRSRPPARHRADPAAGSAQRSSMSTNRSGGLLPFNGSESTGSDPAPATVRPAPAAAHAYGDRAGREQDQAGRAAGGESSSDHRTPPGLDCPPRSYPVARSPRLPSAPCSVTS